MPALLVDTSNTTPTPHPRPTSSSDASTTSDRSGKHSDSASPDRPPVSPITPTASNPQLAPVPRTESRPRPNPPPTATFQKQPPSVPVSESENPDAIALRSAISLLQLQREKSKRDLKALQDLKAAAVSDPQAFARSLQEQRAHTTQATTDILAPTLAGLVDPAQNNGEVSMDGAQPNAEARKDSAHTEANASATQMPPIPQPQNVVRCPPVNWAKYHIVGEPLDKMHEEQKKWPGASEPPRTKSGARAPPHSVTAPFSPFTDGLSQQSKSTPQPTSKGSKKPSQ